MDCQFWPVVIAAIAVIVATVGMIWHGLQTRKHNRLSVKPIIGWFKDFGVSGIEPLAGISFRNDGLGSAIVKKCTAQTEDRVFSLSSSENMDAMLDHLHLRGSGVNHSYLTPGGIAVRAGERFYLFSIERKPEDEEKGKDIEERIKKLESILSPIVYEVDYESVYGEKWTKNSR